MKRPRLIDFIAIQTQSKVAIRASVNFFSDESMNNNQKEKKDDQVLTAPLQSLGLLKSDEFRIKVVAFDLEQNIIFKKSYESDNYGDFEIIIPTDDNHKISSFQIFETSFQPGVDLLLGTRIPIIMKYPKKVVISDFDKTLVDTRYSTAIEVYESLRRPIDYFPTITYSVKKFKNYIEQDYQPFVLTASPHFYKNAIRDWLYQNEIYTADIFLKDYRRVFSILDGLLTTKDLKSQGFYKLNQLVSILLMTGIPDDLVLMGDGFESDPLIYTLLRKLLANDEDPWDIWKKVKDIKAFKLNRKQDSQFLNKVYRLKNEIERKHVHPQVSIFIRKPEHVEMQPIPKNLLINGTSQIEVYEA